MCSIVILLYLLDNETSILILGSVVIGLIIELWKIRKSVKISVSLKGFKIEEKFGYTDSPTKEYDIMAMKYVGMFLVPIIIGYAAYSLVFMKHTGWYSWFLGSLTSSVYAFGFVRMTPQLFINYKLKSVAHLPWRAFTYKALNTFIDDLFAFIIKMPTLHRMSVFRDDIVFFIYLYQKWLYPVDKNRTNEYGQVAGKEKKESKKHS